MNTDAEGRLVLADGLIYASEQKPELIIDCATLTGAAKNALGNDYHALMSFDDELSHQALTAANQEKEACGRYHLLISIEKCCHLILPIYRISALVIILQVQVLQLHSCLTSLRTTKKAGYISTVRVRIVKPLLINGLREQRVWVFVHLLVSSMSKLENKIDCSTLLFECCSYPVSHFKSTTIITSTERKFYGSRKNIFNH